MKRGQKAWKSVKCPYYRKHDASRIFCRPVRGAVPFDDKEIRHAQMTAFCKGDWQQCFWAEEWHKMEEKRK